MARYLGKGNGADGVVALGSYSLLKYSCSGTSGSTSLTATGTFVAGQRLFIYQTRGTGVGAFEDNRVASYTTGTVTLVHKLENTYTDSGASQAQVLIVKEASKVTGTATVPAWDGNVGGVWNMACSGEFEGIVIGNGKGFRGGRTGYLNSGSIPQSGATGENTLGASVAGQSSSNDQSDNPSPTNNGIGGGGGGGRGQRGDDRAGGGGGAGYATVGVAGTTGGEAAYGGSAGIVVGEATLDKIYLGNGGGGGGKGKDGSDTLYGGYGGAVVIVYTNDFPSTASITVNATNGNNSNSNQAGGGGGAGGSILVKSTSAVLGTLTASLGTGGTGTSVIAKGGNGAVGRIRVESCSVSGTTSPTASLSTGGHSWCGGGAFLL